MSASGSPPYTPFVITVERAAGAVVVAPRGELDLATAGTLDRAVRNLWSTAGDRVLIDLRPLDFIDSSGLRALLTLREATAGGKRELELRPGTAAVQRIFAVTGTGHLFRWSPEPGSMGAEDGQTDRLGRSASGDA
jgi:anti-sigma B factor antagonist